MTHAQALKKANLFGSAVARRGPEPADNDLTRFKEIKDRHRKKLMKLPNVVGVAVGRKQIGGQTTDQNAVVVMVRKKVPSSELTAQNTVPSKLEETATDVVEVGEIKALSLLPTSRFRPAPGGVSVGHFAITAGTLGMTVTKNGRPYILSNNHVLADSNNAKIGDVILQPGPFDGGKAPADTIGRLKEFVPINFEVQDNGNFFARFLSVFFNLISRFFGGQTYLQVKSLSQKTNYVDAALAEPLDDRDLDPQILNLGLPKGIAEARLGETASKSGRTTGKTQGKVRLLSATVTVNYDQKTAVFEDQIIFTSMSQGGDSGSVILNSGRKAIGLLFAGSDKVTLANPINRVMTALSAGI